MKSRTSYKTGKMRRTPFLFRLGYQAAVVDPIQIKRRRASWLKRISLSIIGGAAIFGMVTGYQDLIQLKLFEIRQIEISGLDRLSRSDIEPFLSVEPGKTLFEVDLDVLKERLMGNPWIREVQIRKNYPDRLVLHIFERNPVAIIKEGSRSIWVDETGKALELAVETGSDGPVIEGVNLDALGNGDSHQQATFDNALTVLSVVERTNKISVGREGDYVVERDGYKIRFGGENVREKWDQFISIQPDMHKRKNRVSEVDLRFSGQIVVR